MMVISYLNMLKLNNTQRASFLVGTGLLVGLLFSFQSKSIKQTTDFARENKVNVFKEIQIVKRSNQNLSEQLADLQNELNKGNNKEQALESINKDIARYQLALGQNDIHGPGITITIPGELESLWFTDMVNELFSAGAEAISLNGIRILDQNIGFDTMPNGQILLGGEIISAPFKFEAIGDSKTLLNAVSQAGGIVNRIANFKPKYDILVKGVEDVQMKKVVQE